MRVSPEHSHLVLPWLAKLGLTSVSPRQGQKPARRGGSVSYFSFFASLFSSSALSVFSHEKAV